MADKKISALSAAATPLAGSEVLPIVQGGSTVRVSIANVTAGRAVSTGALSVVGANATLDNAFSLAGKLIAGTPVGMMRRNSSDEVAIDEDGYGVKIGFGGRYAFAGGGNFTVGIGNVVIGTAGKGIDFSANTHAAGMTSELLNWYEEGTWTPSDASGAGLTFTVIRGRYTRVGRQVFCSGLIVYPSTANGSTALLGGLPFTSANPFGGGFTGDGGYFTFQTNNAVTNLAVNPNATTVNLYTNTGGTVANSALSLSTLGFAIQYEAA
jgi:hypothetical protein